MAQARAPGLGDLCERLLGLPLVEILDESGTPFRVGFIYVNDIPRGPGGKYEDFVSEVARKAGF